MWHIPFELIFSFLGVGIFLSVIKLLRSLNSFIDLAIGPSMGHLIPSTSVNWSSMHSLQKKCPHLNKYGKWFLLSKEFLQNWHIET